MKLTDEEHYYLNRASEKCASYWFIALPIERHNCNLITAEFRDGIALRYGEAPRHLTVNCPCGKPFSIFHDLRCAKGGYTHRRDTIRDTLEFFSAVPGYEKIAVPLRLVFSCSSCLSELCFR